MGWPGGRETEWGTDDAKWTPEWTLLELGGGRTGHHAPPWLVLCLLWRLGETVHSKISPSAPADQLQEEQRQAVAGPRADSYLSDKMNFPSLRLGSFFRGLTSLYSLLWW